MAGGLLLPLGAKKAETEVSVVGTPLQPCRVVGCSASIPPALLSESLCLDHFAYQVFARARLALDLFQEGRAVDSGTIDWLFSDAQYAVQTLVQDSQEENPAQREGVLQLLLCLANLNEYLRHHSVQLKSHD